MISTEEHGSIHPRIRRWDQEPEGRHERINYGLQSQSNHSRASAMAS